MLLEIFIFMIWAGGVFTIWEHESCKNTWDKLEAFLWPFGFFYLLTETMDMIEDIQKTLKENYQDQDNYQALVNSVVEGLESRELTPLLPNPKDDSSLETEKINDLLNEIRSKPKDKKTIHPAIYVVIASTFMGIVLTLTVVFLYIISLHLLT